MTHLIWLLVALPAAGAAILLLGGRRADAWGHLLGCATALASFGVGLTLLSDMLSRHGDARTIVQNLFTWIPVGGLQVDFGMQIDQLSICFVLLITGVGSLIHIYSIAYMAEDTDRRRFFAYLNLFLAAMLLLVIADNFVGLYAGWEGVGLASYLLIGFWYHKPTAAAAAKKAFVMNRVGDAVEGPTPVSALIHAATMVTAGVYLIVRCNPLYSLSPDARLGVIIVGAVTLMFGAIIGCAKDDIK